MQRELGWSRLETSRQIEATAAQLRAFRTVQAGKVPSLPESKPMSAKAPQATFAK
jgi:hypothetical protein